MTAVWAACLIASGVAYVVLLRMMLRGLDRLRKAPPLPPPAIAGGEARASIVVSARNEAKWIGRTLDSILAQDYPADKTEIIVVDDRSGDSTAAVVESYSRRDPRIKLIRQKSVEPAASPKKQALEVAVAASSGEIIVTTDADCTHPREWLHTLIGAFTPETGMVAGQARFELPNRAPIWQHLQALDFQSQNVAAAGLIAANSPFNCSGASLAFRRAAYNAVGGWRGVRHLISGDDELLMAKMHRAKWKIVAAIGPAVVVKTRPPATIKELWHQRTRWGSKVRAYSWVQKFLLSGTFIFLLALTVSPAILLFGDDPKWIAKIILGAVAAKLLIDLAILRRGQQLFQDRIALLDFFLAEIIHPVAIVVLAIGGTFGTFEWKGGRYRRGEVR